MHNISVIIPTYNAQKYLPNLLENLSKQSLDFELIIIDSSSSDDTLKIAKSYTDRVFTIPKSEFDHGETRTKASKLANGDILIFLTQDALPVGSVELEKLIEPIINNRADAVYGRQLANANATIFARHLREYNYTDISYVREFKDAKKYGIKTAFFSDSFSAYKKETIESVGYFKEGTIVGEDMHLVARVLLNGGKVAYCANAVVYHSHNYTIREDFARYFDTGVFHTTESWLVDKFGKVEGEGKRYIKSEAKYIIEKRAYFKFIEFVVRNGAKFVGYKLGKNYKKLPKKLAKKLSMHKSWWDRWY